MQATIQAYRDIPTKAFLVREQGAPFELQDVILDEVRPGEVLVEMLYTGICHTDLVVQSGGMPIGAYPAVLGHEGVGIVKHVASSPSAVDLRPGDKVILSFRTCQNCLNCRKGSNGGCPGMTEYNFVRSRRDVIAPSPISLPDGKPVHGQFFGQSSMSKLAVVDAQSVVRIEGVSDKDLPFLAGMGCGFLTGAGTVMNALSPSAESSILIVGVGAVGMAAMLAAKYLGLSPIIAADMSSQKLSIARRLGATHTIDTTNEPLEEAVRRTCPAGVHSGLDSTGVTSVQEAILRSLGHGGTMALVGVPKPGAEMKVDALDMLLSCKRLIGVIEGLSHPRTFIPRLVHLYKQGEFPVDNLARVYPANGLNDAIQDLKSGAVVKPVISWENV